MATKGLPFGRFGCIFFLTPFLTCLCPAAQAKRKDVVVMNNGDHFTGEVKRLQNGLLFVETEYVSGNIGLDWSQVQSVHSTATYRIVLNNGRRLDGKIEKDSSNEESDRRFGDSRSDRGSASSFGNHREDGYEKTHVLEAIAGVDRRRVQLC